MKEEFLHFIWQFQYFDHQDLQTACGKTITVNEVGVHNECSGPDFLEAHLSIGRIEWHGNIEIHIKSSNWKKHKHQKDKAYGTTILHVVWEDDEPVKYDTGEPIPVLQLKEIVNSKLIQRYEGLVNTLHPIPCQNQLSTITALVYNQSLQNSLINRLERKASEVKTLLQHNDYDWRETTYQLLAKNMGFKVNQDAFLNLAQKTPYKVIQKHIDQPLQIEALLFGQSNLIGNAKDEYASSLKKEYYFLSSKYGLSPQCATEWRFMRLRPANFPTIRIAQFVQILLKQKDLFSTLLSSSNTRSLHSFFEVATSDYWKTHYRFQEDSDEKEKSLGSESINTIIINTVCQLFACYAIEKKEYEFMEKSIYFLESLPPEKNKITKLYTSNGLKLKTAADSQGALELYSEKCTQKKCTSCTIGFNLLKEKSKNTEA